MLRTVHFFFLQFFELEVVIFYTNTSIELLTNLLPFLTRVDSTDSLLTLSRILVSNFRPGFQFGLANFTAAYIAVLYCPSYCSSVGTFIDVSDPFQTKRETLNVCHSSKSAPG